MNDKTKDASENPDPDAIAAAAARAIQESFRPPGTITDDDRANAVTLTMHKALIIKDQMCKVPVDIFAYELPVLFAIYGEDGIQVLEEFTRDVDVAGFDVDLAYDKLLEKYGQHGEPFVRSIYNQGPYSLAQELGVESERPRGAMRAQQKATSIQIDHAVDSAEDVAKAEARILPPKTTATRKTGAAPADTKAVEKGKSIAAGTSAAAKKAAKKAAGTKPGKK